MGRDDADGKSDLKWKKSGNTVHLSGQIDEYADLSSLLQEKDPLRINFKNVTRLNSVGVRNLLTFIRDWGDRPITYVECPDIVMDQLSMVKDLMGMGQRVAEVESFYAPYACDSCDHETEFLISVADLKSNELKLLPKKCPKCSAPMDPELSTEFLQFLEE